MKRKISKFRNSGKIRLRRDVERLADVVIERDRAKTSVRDVLLLAYWSDSALFRRHWSEVMLVQEGSDD